MEGRAASASRSDKSATTALLLCLFLGGLGVHRFYVGKIGTGILMILTAGGLGIWTLVDLINIASGWFTDKDGKCLEFTKSSESPTKKVLFVLAMVFASLVMYVTLIVMIVMYATSGLVTTVRDQLSAIRAGHYEQAYAYTSSDFKSATSLEDFKHYIDQYPALKDNVDSTFNSRSIENNAGSIKGDIKGKDGSTAMIEYALIYENGAWKILNMKVNPEGAGVITESRESDDESEVEADADAPKNGKYHLSQLFESRNNRYSINYPSNWEYTQPDKATVVFSGKSGSDQYDSTVNIQTILTKNNGGNYNDVNEFMQSLKEQAISMAKDTKIIAEDNISVEASAESQGMQGKYIIFTYTYQGVKYKQLQFAFEREDQQAFYAWAYTSPIKRYDQDYDTAKAMFGTWEVH